MPIGRAASKGYDRTRRKGAFVASQLNKLTRHFEGDAQIGGSNETLLSIGQMARLNAVSEKALRLYQTKGILDPAYTDETSGYRYYTLGQCATLDMICQLRCVGFSLDEIAETLKDSDVATLRNRVRDHVRQIETQMHELAQATCSAPARSTWTNRRATSSCSKACPKGRCWNSPFRASRPPSLTTTELMPWGHGNSI